MAFSWSPKEMLVICTNEADIEVLIAAGYQAILQPADDDFGAMPKADHYIVAAHRKSHDLAKELVASGVCPDWQVSVNNLGGYQDLTHAVQQGGVDMVRDIVRKSKSLYDAEVHPFIEVHKPDLVPAYPTGWGFLEPCIRWTIPEFGVFCGPYAGGKSQVLR